MPVRWDANMTTMLFLTIMNTHSVTVDAQKVVDAWPKDGDEKPTPRAIKEKLGKIKKEFSSKAGSASATSTPVKFTGASKAKPRATPRSAGKKGKKRKKADDSSDSDSPAPSSTRKASKDLGGGSPTPKRNASATIEPACLLSNGSGTAAPANRNLGYPTPADTASPAEVPTYRSTPRRAASANISTYIKEEQSGSNEDEDDEEINDDEVMSEAESDISAWEGNLIDV